MRECYKGYTDQIISRVELLKFLEGFKLIERNSWKHSRYLWFHDLEKRLINDKYRIMINEKLGFLILFNIYNDSKVIFIEYITDAQY